VQFFFSEILEPPAEQTHLCAMGDSRGHLQALMRVDAVERLFVALSAKQQALFHPMAEFHPGMVSDNRVMLPSKYFL
jgi:hypothetical protein